MILRYNPFNWILLILSSLVLLFILAPLTGLLLNTGSSEFFETAGDQEVQQSIWLTLWVSFVATLVSALGAVPLAWIMARRNFPLKNIVQGIIDLPVVLPHTAAGIAVLGFISRDGALGKAADALGLNFVNNPSGIAFAMAFVSIPFLINSARDGFAAVPEKLEKAALNLGASRSRAFFTISLPCVAEHSNRICNDVCTGNERVWSSCDCCLSSDDCSCSHLRKIYVLWTQLRPSCFCSFHPGSPYSFHYAAYFFREEKSDSFDT